MYEIGFILFIGTISGIVGLFLGMMVEKSTPGFFLGAFLGPIGWIIVFLLPREEDPKRPPPSSLTTPQQPPTRDLSADSYKIWLGKTYSISKNDLFEKYECRGKLFDTLDEALIFADGLEHHRLSDEKRQEAAAQAGELNQIRDLGPEGDMPPFAKAFLIFLFVGSVVAVLVLT